MAGYRLEFLSEFGSVEVGVVRRAAKDLPCAFKYFSKRGFGTSNCILMPLIRTHIVPLGCACSFMLFMDCLFYALLRLLPCQIVSTCGKGPRLIR